MNLKVLAEDTRVAEHFGTEHGLSLYIETGDHKILFDMGESGLFPENAKKLGVDISHVDFAVISHGHDDHGGGLRVFFENNHKAKVYVQRSAFGKYYALSSKGEMESAGLDETLMQNNRVVLTSGRFTITEEILLFSNIDKGEPYSKLNKDLYMERKGEIVKDSFEHEQVLILSEEGKTFLITGCAHNGIVNILAHAKDILGRMPDYVIGGFHLYECPSLGDEGLHAVDKIAEYLLHTNTEYYTCHCTGLESYHRLKAVMGNQIHYLHAGSEITI